MSTASKIAYRELASSHDIVPVYHEIVADFETPVSVLARFRDTANVFLLESLEGGERWGRYSFVAVDPQLVLEIDHAAGGATGELESLRGVYRDVTVADVPGLPRFFGGVVGYLSFEAVNEFERMPPPDMQNTRVRPCSRFFRVDQMVVFDNVRHTIKIVICTHPDQFSDPDAAYDDAWERIRSIEAVIAGPRPPCEVRTYAEPSFESNMPAEAFKANVDRAKQYIVDGDVIQVVLSQRFTSRTEVPPFEAYRALRLLNPSPYTFFLKMNDQVLVGSSPEVMVRLSGKTVEVRPIAGTRPRGVDDAHDEALAEELLNDEKERAEHVMLVDLGRNDVGRVSEAGTVEVAEFMVIERYSHVMHIVSEVKGSLAEGLDALDVIGATFPAGTLSGAPKIRAMQIINELEPEPRGAYGGAVGYISYNGNMDLAITIRTLEFADGEVSVQAGAGIVYDSDPQKEFEETIHKSRGMQKAMHLAARGLDLEEGGIA